MNKKEAVERNVDDKEKARHQTSGPPDKLRQKHGTDLAHGVGHKHGSATLEPGPGRGKQKGSE